MEEIFSEKDNNCFSLTLAEEFYSPEAITAAAQKFTGKCAIAIQSMHNSGCRVLFACSGHSDKDELKKIALEFSNELIEQQLRVKLEARFGNMRDLIVRQAFLPISNLQSALQHEIQ